MTSNVIFEYTTTVIGNKTYGMGWTDTTYTGSIEIPSERTLAEIKHYGQNHLKSFLEKREDYGVVITSKFIIDLSDESPSSPTSNNNHNG